MVRTILSVVLCFALLPASGLLAPPLRAHPAQADGCFGPTLSITADESSALSQTTSCSAPYWIDIFGFQYDGLKPDETLTLHVSLTDGWQVGSWISFSRSIVSVNATWDGSPTQPFTIDADGSASVEVASAAITGSSALIELGRVDIATVGINYKDVYEYLDTNDDTIKTFTYSGTAFRHTYIRLLHRAWVGASIDDYGAVSAGAGTVRLTGTAADVGLFGRSGVAIKAEIDQPSPVRVEPSSATTYWVNNFEGAVADFVVYADLDSFGSSPFVTGKLRLRAAVDSAEVESTTDVKLPYARVQSVQGDVQRSDQLGVGWSAAQPGDVLAPGQFIRLGDVLYDAFDRPIYPEVSIRFADFTVAEVGQSGARNSRFVFQVDAGKLSLTKDEVWENVKLVLRKGAAKGLSTVVPGGPVVQFVAQNGIDYAIKTVASGSGGLSAQALRPQSGFDTDVLGLELLGLPNAQLQITNNGSPIIISGGGTSTVALWNTTAMQNLATGGVSPPASLPRSPANPLTLTVAFAGPNGAPLSTPLATRTPELHVLYPGAAMNPIDPSGLVVRINGRLVTALMRTTEVSAVWQLPPEYALRSGANQIEATVETLTGDRTSVSISVDAAGVPPAPGSVGVRAGKTAIGVLWNPNSDLETTGYRVSRAASALGPWTTLAVLDGMADAGQAYFDSAPPAGVVWYQVDALSAAGTASAPSHPISATLAPSRSVLPPAAPALSASAGDHQVTLTFTATSSVVAYSLKRAEAATGPWSDIPAAGRYLVGNVYTDRTAITGHTYWYQLVPLGFDLVAGTPTIAGPVTPSDIAPQTPAGFGAVLDRITAELAWNPSSDSDLAGYRVYRAAPGAGFAPVGDSLLTSARFAQTVDRGAVWLYRVVAVDAAGHESTPTAAKLVSGRAADEQQILLLTQATGGIASADQPGVQYPLGQNIVVLAQAEAGYYFSGWTGDITSTLNPLPLTMNSDIRLTPVFLPLPVAGALPASTLAGTGAYGTADGLPGAFIAPIAVALAPDGTLVVIDGNRVRRVDIDGRVTTLAGGAGAGYLDATGPDARFDSPSGVTVDSSGVIYVADTQNQRIRRITPGGMVTTLAGSGTPTFRDGMGTTASFNFPSGITIGADSALYVVDRFNSAIRRVALDGQVTTFAGTTEPAFGDGPRLSAKFRLPLGIARCGDGLVVADTGNQRIRRIAADGMVTAIAGTGDIGQADGVAAASTFSEPAAVACQGDSVFIVDRGNNRLRVLWSNGTVATLSGGPRGYFEDPMAAFATPTGLAVTANGNLAVADTGNLRIRLVTLRATATLGPGATLTFAWSTRALAVTLPAGAMSSTVAISAVGSPSGAPGGMRQIGSAFQIEAESPLNLLLVLSEAELPAGAAIVPELRRWDGSAWAPLNVTVASVSRLSASTTTLKVVDARSGVYAVFSPPLRTFAPLASVGR